MEAALKANSLEAGKASRSSTRTKYLTVVLDVLRRIQKTKARLRMVLSNAHTHTHTDGKHALLEYANRSPPSRKEQLSCDEHYGCDLAGLCDHT